MRPSCIYCEGPLPARPPREHVIPKGLTAGFSDNLTIGCVCPGCNDYFGRELDSLFVEQTPMAPLRYQHRIKKDTRRPPAADTGRFSLRFRGMLVRLQPSADGEGYELHIPTQVGFPSRRKPEGQFEYFALDGLDDALSDPAIGHEKYHVVGQGRRFKAEAVAALRARGLTPGLEPEEHTVLPRQPDGAPQTSIEVQFEMIVDRVIKRCMAKIAFNYLARVVGRRLRSSEWLLRPDFDLVRDFVRQEDTKAGPFVSAELEMQARDLAGRKTQVPLGHSATLAWSRYGADIEARISLFSTFSWRVTLARSFGGIRWDFRSGHFWDFSARRVLPMGPAAQS